MSERASRGAHRNRSPYKRPDERFPPVYARLLGWHERTGRRVPTMDLLIATAAVVDQAPLVTRNVKDFSRIPDLVVLGY